MATGRVIQPPMSEAVAGEIKAAGRGLHVSEIIGLHALTAELGPGAPALEIGAGHGSSTLAMAAAGARVVSIDPRRSQRWRNNVAAWGFNTGVEEINLLSPWVDNLDEWFELVFIDGDHRTPSVIADAIRWTAHLRPDGGRLAFHDFWLPSVAAAIALLRPHFKRVLKFDRLIDGPCGIIVFEKFADWPPEFDAEAAGALPMQMAKEERNG